MFRNYMDLSDSLTAEILNKYRYFGGFDNTMYDYAIDAAFIMTVQPRLKVENSFYAYNLARAYQWATLKDNKDIYCLQIFAGSEEKTQNEMANLGMEPEGERQTQIEEFMDRKYAALCTQSKIYVDSEHNNVIVVVNSTEAAMIITDFMRGYVHLLLSFLPVLYSNLFAVNKLSQNEYRFFKSLSETSSFDFEAAFLSLYLNSEIYQNTLRARLHGFEKNILKSKLGAAEVQISNYRNLIRDVLDQYKKYEHDKMNAVYAYEGLKRTVDTCGDSSEFEQYLLSNPNLFEIRMNDNFNLSFTIRTHLDSYDVDGWPLVADNIIRGIPTSKKDDLRLVLDHVFSNKPDLKIRMCAAWCIDFDTNCASTRMHYAYEHDGEIYKTYVPNPHMDYFSCLGQNGPDIIACLSTGNMIDAIEYCIAATKAVNIHEAGPTFIPFISNIVSSNKKCFEAKDGTLLTWKEAANMLKEEQNATDLAE